MKAPMRFVQITSSKDYLYGLDNAGYVWRKPTHGSQWERIEAPEIEVEETKSYGLQPMNEGSNG